ncbi:hypothetical protein [Streptomyces zingiberis]|uniref:Core-binding (CB) domain-containing protein n=1 Tax=Streptomyces zingiberis TaxID=2053010 RepID=A0ABX1BVJ3_9ACTN|nr:hypothetical protein [Streptomyces zingiberis]NJQ01727.1 hypothetical protein [Streptomyces zingiberis]
MSARSGVACTVIDEFLGTLSGSTRAQRRTYLHEYVNYLESLRSCEKSQLSVADFLDPANISSWLAAAHEGATRRRAGAEGPRAMAAPNSMAARIATLNTFSRFCGSPLRLSRPRPQAAERLTPVEAHRTVRLFAGCQPPRMTTETWERSVAVVALAVCTGHGLSDLRTMRLRDVELGYRLPRVRVAGSWYPLDAFTRGVLARWLVTREGLVPCRVTGRPDGSLWVTTSHGRTRSGYGGPPSGAQPATVRTLVSAHRNLTTQLLGFPLRLEQFCGREDGGRHPYQAVPAPAYPSPITTAARPGRRFGERGPVGHGHSFLPGRRPLGGPLGR